MKKYLQFLGHEKEKRVLKGLMAQLTTPEFVQREFGWRKESIARITEELNGMNQFFSGLDNLYHIVGAASAYQRRKQRAVAQAALKVTGFMLRKGSHGGRPSLLLQYSCCLGGVVKGLLEELDYGGKADRRRQNAALHRGGHASLDVVWLQVLHTPCCRTGDLISILRSTLHRAYKPARKDSVAGRLHR